ncbi:MAG: winged helix-turn-helix transcriptional regulator [Candidatus Aenigmarchaeota archaeon]|nr:winged helix-turn-helix transcriptional regulator [Candidatus Aenigmarchaeota archaeon]
MKGNSYKLFVKAFGSETRLDIIELLRKRSLSVSEIHRKLDLEQSRVSHNLKCLIDCGFVTSKKLGKKRMYSINKSTVSPILEAINRHVEKYHDHLVKCGVIEKEVK